MSEVDLSNLSDVGHWLSKQTVAARSLISNRASLRVLSNINSLAGNDFEKFALVCFRASMSAAYIATGKNVDVGWAKRELEIERYEKLIRSRIFVAAESDEIAIYKAALSAISKEDALSEAVESARFTDNTEWLESDYGSGLVSSIVAPVVQPIVSPITTSIPSASVRPITSERAVRREIKIDCQRLQSWQDPKIAQKALYSFPVWSNEEIPWVLRQNHETFLETLAADPKWAYWRDWYLKMWEGDPVDWDIAFEVIKIDDAVWEEGAEAVAEEIKRLEAKWSCPVYVPVSQLIYAAFRSNAKGLLPPSDEWRRRGL